MLLYILFIYLFYLITIKIFLNCRSFLFPDWVNERRLTIFINEYKEKDEVILKVYGNIFYNLLVTNKRLFFIQDCYNFLEIIKKNCHSYGYLKIYEKLDYVKRVDCFNNLFYEVVLDSLNIYGREKRVSFYVFKGDKYLLDKFLSSVDLRLKLLRK